MKDTLLILTPGFPANEADSTCLPPQQVFVQALRKYYPALNVLIISFHYPYRKASYTWNGIPVISFGGKNKGGLSKWLLRRRIEKEIEQINKETNLIGLLSFWCGECALLGHRFATRHHKKHFCWILGQDAKENNRFVRKIKPKPEDLIALSDFITETFHQNYGIAPRHVIPPGTDPDLFDHSPPIKDIDLLAAGSLIPLKQFNIFLQVIAAVKKEFPAIKAALAGNGPELASLQALVIRLGIEENIRFAGELHHIEVLRLMQRAKVFLHPSSYEGFGVVCIEALHAGAKVISFCQPMKKEISGWHIAPDPDTMIFKTIELLKNPAANKRGSPFLIRDTASAVMQLFGYTDPITR